MITKEYNKSVMWNEFTKDVVPNDIVTTVQNPAIFQKELSVLLNGILNGHGSTIEVGCEEGITSYLLNCDKRCFFDLNGDIIEKTRRAHGIIFPEKNEDSFVIGDMFNMPFNTGTFDMAFNAGVLEHFSSESVVCALKEMKRITVGGGYVIVAIPNHYSYVYRSAYLFGCLLDKLHIKKWPWPKENKYYDMQNEIAEAGLIYESRRILSKDSIWNWWAGKKLFFPRLLLKVINKIKPSEGYLLVLITRKATDE